MGLILLVLTISSCKTHSKYSLNHKPSNYIAYGSFGGFSGNVTTYSFFPNGQIFSTQSISKDTTELSSMKAREAKKLFRELNESDFLKTDFIEPDNMSYFLSTFQNGKIIHQVVWGQNGDVPPLAIQPIVKKLDSIISEKSPKTIEAPYNDNQNESEKKQ